MSDFSQNGVISTLHDFNTKSTSIIESELLEFSKQRKMELILPCLYSELDGSALPKIVDEISKTKYFIVFMFIKSGLFSNITKLFFSIWKHGSHIFFSHFWFNRNSVIVDIVVNFMFS